MRGLRKPTTELEHQNTLYTGWPANTCFTSSAIHSTRFKSLFPSITSLTGDIHFASVVGSILLFVAVSATGATQADTCQRPRSKHTLVPLFCSLLVRANISYRPIAVVVRRGIERE
jgi:hypothetical protein